MKQLGFIGLGVMGLPMCRNLLKAEHPVVAYEIRREILAEAVKDGATPASSPKDVASQADVTITMLPDSPQVKEVMLGPGGVLEGARPGSLVIDMSSIAPAAAKEVGAALAAKGVRFLEAPVSGGQPGAIAGTLSIMVGGAPADFEEAEPLLRLLGKSVVRVGEVGAGNTTKLANQIIVALNIAAVGEAFTLATKAGVDPEVVFEAIRGGLAGSHVMDAKVPLLLSGKFEPGFRINLHVKDLNNALETGKQLKVPLPFTALVFQILESLQVAGKGDLDHGALSTFFEQLAGVEVRRKP
jgi:2-hydroxy-3-oxopropionate reductase